MKFRLIKAWVLLALLSIGTAPVADAVERVDQLVLPGIETYLQPVLVDPAGEFAYAASGTAFLSGVDDKARGLIVKFDLATFERVDSIYIDWNYTDGFRFFNTGFIDPEGRFAYFANGLQIPAQIVKIDLETFELVDSLHTSFEEKDYISSVVDPQGEFAYLGTANGRLVKVDLDTFERADGLNIDQERIRSLVIDPAGEFMYIGTEDTFRPDQPPRPGKIFKMDLATFETVDWFELNGLNAYAAAMHPSGELAWFRVDGQLLTVDLMTFEPVDSIPIGNSSGLFIRPNSLQIDSTGRFLYIRDSSGISRFDLDTMEKTDFIDGLSRFFTLDPTREAIYTPTREGLVKVDTESFEQVDLAETDDGFVRVWTGAIDPAGEFGYFAGATQPDLGRVEKVDLESMESVDSIELDDEHSPLFTALIDPAGEYGYFTRRGSPGTVDRLNLTTFEWDGFVEFQGVAVLLTAIMGPNGRYAYFGAAGDPPDVVRLDLETFEPAGTIALQRDESILLSSAIDPAGKYAYFGAGHGGRKIVKIDLETFTRVGALEFEGPTVTTAAIDPAGEYGYFGVAGKMVKIDLATFEPIDSIGAVSSASMMDPTGRYLYLHNGGNPPRVSRIDLETFTNVETVPMTGRERGLADAIIDPAGEFLWIGANGNEREPARVVRVALLRSAQMQHSAVTINGGAPEPFAYSAPGDVIDYSFAVNSDGNVTLTGVTVGEPQLDPLSCDPAAPATLAPGDSMVCSGSYTVTQADLDAGSFSTFATTAIDKTDPLDAEATVMAAQNPVITLTGTITDGDGYQSVGETISYALTAMNTGNVTLSDVAINDPDGVFGSCDDLPDGALAPGESTSCEGSHTVTQVDLDAGSFSVATTASATDPGANPVQGSGAATAGAMQNPLLALVKSSSVERFIAAGDLIDYTIIATNEGNVSLTGLTVVDVLLDALECTPMVPAQVAPGQQVECSGTHVATEDDVAAGRIVNIATANSDQTDPVDATATVELELIPEILLTPASMDFGAVLVNEGNEVRTLMLENIGNGEMQLGSISEPPPPFTLAGGSCLPAPTIIAAGEDCTILVAFAPVGIGNSVGGFEIVSDAPSSPDAVGLTGNGIISALPVPASSPVALALLVLLFSLTGALVLLPGARDRSSV